MNSVKALAFFHFEKQENDLIKKAEFFQRNQMA